MLWSGFLLGLVGSLHCVGMCGPIAFMLPVSHNKPLKKALEITLYHTGRILAYALIGLVFALLGQTFMAFGYQQHISIAVGVLMIVLPCGLVYMAVIGAFATEAFSGSISYMVLFGLGTVPMMTTVVYAQSFIKKHLKFNYKKLIPIAVVIVGLLFILRGMGLGIKYISPKLNPQTEQVDAQVECH